MANDASLPSLALSDIIHTMSPSPVFRQSPEEPSVVQEREQSPEPLTPEDIERIRVRVQEMGLECNIKGQESAREKELMAMVLRLTGFSFIAPSQLVQQGEMISNLILQRDYLIRQAEEERERFTSERDGWSRAAEALIAQRHKPGSSGMREQELERQCSSVRSDNRSLRAKLLDTQNRFLSLESELNSLKPLLLLNPGPSSLRQETAPSYQSPSKTKGKQAQRNSVPADLSTTDEGGQVASHTRQSSQGQLQESLSHAPSQSSSSQELYSRSSFAPSREHIPRTVHVVAQHARSRSLLSSPHGTGCTTQQASAVPGPSNSKKSSRSSKSGRRTIARSILPITSDAKTEHILLAARKIGRERASAVAGVRRAAEQEKEKLLREQEAARISKETERLERERLERLANGSAGMGYYRRETVEIGNPAASSVSGQGRIGSSTPQRANLGASHYPPVSGSTNPPPAGTSFVFVGTLGGSSNYTNPGPPTPVNSATNSQDHSKRLVEPAQNQQQHQDQQNSSTPLASLLSAASMLDDGRSGPSNGHPSAPQPNGASRGRRKSSAVEPSELPLPKRRRVALSSSGVKSVARVRSALDVLADQAAAAFTNEADPINHASESSRTASTRKTSTSTTARAKGKGNAKESDSTSSRKSAVATPIVNQEKDTGATLVKGRTRVAKAKGKAKAILTSAPVSAPSVTARKPRVRPPPRDRSAISTVSSGKGTGKDDAEIAVGPRMISPPGHRLIVSAAALVQQSSTDALSPVVVQTNDIDDLDRNRLRDGQDESAVMLAFDTEENLGDTIESGNSGGGSGSLEVPMEFTSLNQSDGMQEEHMLDASLNTLPETHTLTNNPPPSMIHPVLDSNLSLTRLISSNAVDSLGDSSQSVEKSREFELDHIVRLESSIPTSSASLPLPEAEVLPGTAQSLNSLFALETCDTPMIADEQVPATPIHEEDVHDIDAEADEDEDAEGENDDEIRNEGEKEQGGEEEPEDTNHIRQPTSRNPSPVPPSGIDSRGPLDTDEHDTDADAEGEEDNETEETSHPVRPDMIQNVITEGQAVQYHLGLLKI